MTTDSLPNESPPPTVKSRSVLKQVFGLARWPLAIGILTFLFYQHRDGFAEIRTREFLWTWVLAAIAFRTISLTICCVRWWSLVRAQDIPFRFKDALRLGCLGNLFNFVVPGTVGGDVTKALMITRERPEAKMIVAATVFLDRVLGLLSLLLLGSLAALAHQDLWSHPQLAMAMMAFAAGSALGLLAIAVMLHPAATNSRLAQKLTEIPRIGGIVKELIKGVGLYQSRRSVLVGAILISLVGHSANVTAYFCCAEALQITNQAPPYGTHLLIVPVAELAASFLPLPGGIGAREGALQYLYGMTTTTTGDLLQSGFYVAVAFSLISIVVAVFTGAWAFFCQREDVKAEVKTEVKQDAQQGAQASAMNTPAHA
jgi:glycosyltransferase 2 family protein